MSSTSTNNTQSNNTQNNSPFNISLSPLSAPLAQTSLSQAMDNAVLSGDSASTTPNRSSTPDKNGADSTRNLATQVSQKNDTNKQAPPSKTVIHSPKLAQATPSFTKVNFLVSGTPHRIQCPSNEVENLHRTVDAINAALRDIRRASGKNPSNEEALTLHCLNLHDEINELKKQLKEAQEQDTKAIALIDGILKTHRTS